MVRNMYHEHAYFNIVIIEPKFMSGKSLPPSKLNKKHGKQDTLQLLGICLCMYLFYYQIM